MSQAAYEDRLEFSQQQQQQPLQGTSRMHAPERPSFADLVNLVAAGLVEPSAAIDQCVNELAIVARPEKRAAAEALLALCTDPDSLPAVDDVAVLRRLKTAAEQQTRSAEALTATLDVLWGLWENEHWREKVAQVLPAILGRIRRHLHTAPAQPGGTTPCQPSSSLDSPCQLSPLAEAAAAALCRPGAVALMAEEQLLDAASSLATLLQLKPGSEAALHALSCLQLHASAVVEEGEEEDGGSGGSQRLPLPQKLAEAFNKGGGPGALVRVLAYVLSDAPAEADDSAAPTSEHRQAAAAAAVRCLRKHLEAAAPATDIYSTACVAAMTAGAVPALGGLLRVGGDEDVDVALHVLLLIVAGAGADAAALVAPLIGRGSDGGGSGSAAVSGSTNIAGAALRHLNARLSRADSPLTSAVAAALLDAAGGLAIGLTQGSGGDVAEALEEEAPAVLELARCIVRGLPALPDTCEAARDLAAAAAASHAGGADGTGVFGGGSSACVENTEQIEAAAARLYMVAAGTVAQGSAGKHLSRRLTIPHWVKADALDLAQALTGGDGSGGDGGGGQQRQPAAQKTKLRCLAACVTELQDAGMLAEEAELRSRLERLAQLITTVLSEQPLDVRDAGTFGGLALQVLAAAATKAAINTSLLRGKTLLRLAGAMLDSAAASHAAADATDDGGGGNGRTLRLLVDTVMAVAADDLAEATFHDRSLLLSSREFRIGCSSVSAKLNAASASACSAAAAAVAQGAGDGASTPLTTAALTAAAQAHRFTADYVEALEESVTADPVAVELDPAQLALPLPRHPQQQHQQQKHVGFANAAAETQSRHIAPPLPGTAARPSPIPLNAAEALANLAAAQHAQHRVAPGPEHLASRGALPQGGEEKKRRHGAAAGTPPLAAKKPRQ